jgi:hypothetical protein
MGRRKARKSTGQYAVRNLGDTILNLVMKRDGPKGWGAGSVI